MISIDDFKKLDIRIGTILGAEKVPDTDKLLKLSVDVGEGDPRQIISGIAEFVEPDELVGKQLPFILNLEPRVIRGEESNGMILAASALTEEGRKLALLFPHTDLPAGSQVS